MTAASANPARTDKSGLVMHTASRIMSWLADNRRGAVALDTCNKLASLSESELSHQGIKRNQIVKHVFSHYY